MAHGSDPFMKNQEGQVPLELATAYEDVKCLLQDAMLASQPTVDTQTALASSSSGAQTQSPLSKTETVMLPTGASWTIAVPIPQVNLI